MSCQRCGSERVANLQAKCNDCCGITFRDGTIMEGYVPQQTGVGSGDYIEIDYCLDCGQIQGEFPRPPIEEWIAK